MYLNQDVHPGNLRQQESHGWVSLDMVREAGQGVPTKEECIAGGLKATGVNVGTRMGLSSRG